MRRPIAVAAALALVAEAVVIVFVNMVLGLAVKRQSMSLGGLKPGAMTSGAWAAGAVLGLYLLVCAVIEVRTAVRDRAPGRVNRLLLVVCAVVQGVLGAVVVGMVGWAAFGALMVVLALLVATLVIYPRPVIATSP
ncbi:hypothetical protein POF50_012390 [Streptomyces sp. SL13]|jgi:hypothetical protein|uniref:Uncharacterized protein n=1 Tax=Streptantibioticus silvisoli TaxID=2705255 RepID=A0AA90GXS5_9ACTN|nr:hypothetical protein [Streptantibioticus silvisoli]MDI5966863.1 hypothetical protein [Streptantibioticus silvisoli]MDI5970128.1 hypothetical protein [Streptantibioticus silvisoli]